MNFNLLQPADYERLNPFFATMPYELCAYSLSSILVWHNPSYATYGTVEKDAFFVQVRFADKRKAPYLVLPISPDREFEPEELAELAHKTGVDAFHFIPKAYIAKYGRDRIASLFSVRSHAEYHDYVYLTQDLATLKGNKYAKKRNLISQFTKECVRRNRVEVQALDQGHAPECLDFLDEWCAQRDCGKDADNDDLSCEKRAVENALNHWSLLGFQGIAVRVDGKVRAFAIGSRLTANMGNLNFEKADANIKGLYQFLDMESAARIFKGYDFINKESDMNLPGLAQAKQSYYPVKMVRSYKLILR